MNCLVLVFSRNRALQLDATLQSFLSYCQDAHLADVRVLFAVSDAMHAQQYRLLQQEYLRHHCVRFVKEQDFCSDVLTLLAIYDHVLFLVDDNIFIRPFRLRECIDALTTHADALGVSLRLGRNTTFCYPMNAEQRLPEFSLTGSGCMKFKWTEGEHDFGYPLEVSSSLYRIADLYDLILKIPFVNPNTLEGELATQIHNFSRHMPFLLCYEHSLTFCNPINMVQTAWENRAGQDPGSTPESLAIKFEEGYRIDVHSYSQLTPRGAHQEVPLQLIPSPGKSPNTEPHPFHPMVTVVIPCYNQAEYLPEAVQSVIAQSFTDWEIVIVDDGSTDATAEVSQALSFDCPDGKIRIVRQSNQGLATARNSGIQVACGQYILPLDADDCIHPDMLKHTVSVLQEKPEVSIVYTDTVTFGLKEECWTTGPVELASLCQRNLICYCSLFRRTMWKAVGGYNPNMIWGYEDWDFWVSCWGQGYIGERVPIGLFRYRIREGSMYSRAQARDVELKARIVANHPQLYSQPIQEWAKEIVEKNAPGITDNQNVGKGLTSLNGTKEASCFRILQQANHSEDVMSPLVSVIVPTFNRPELLRLAISSILSQTLRNYEIIVVNDGGQDVGDLLVAFNHQSTISYIRHGRNRGLAAARNSGLGVARGKYIAYLDDDDRFGPRHLEILVEHLSQGPFKVAYSDAWRVWQEEKNGQMVEVKRDLPYSQDFNQDWLLLSNYFPVLCVMHEKHCLETTGGFDETLTTHEDWDLWIRLSRHYPFVHIKEITAEFTWRMDGSSMTSKSPADFLRTKNIIYQKYDAYFQDLPHLIPLRDQELEKLQRRTTQPGFDCSIVIPVFNEVKLTQQCLDHLSESITDVSYEVIVVDNASTDGTATYLSSLGGDIQILRNQENLGFAKACNQGAAVAKGKYLVFLNNDTIPQPGWLEPLIHEADTDSQVGIVGSKLLFPDGKVQHAGIVFSRTYGEPYHFFSGGSSEHQTINRRREMQAVTAACMLVKKDIFKQVAGFDEGYINGFEDVDFCLRVRESGMKIIYQPQSRLYHIGSQTQGRKDHEAENVQRFKSKWSEYWIEDEDAIAVPEGLVIQQTLVGSKLETSLYSREEVKDPASWNCVAEVQRLLLGQRKSSLAQMKNKDRIFSFLKDPAQWPGDIGVLEWAGRVCEILGCADESRRFWGKLLSMADHPTARLGMTRLALQEGDLEQAAIHIEVLKTKFPDKCEGWVVQGIFWIQKEHYVEAKMAFTRALTLDEKHRKARMGMVLACMALEDWELAWEMCEALVLECPDEPECVKLLIQAGTALQVWGKLAHYLSRYIDRNPTDCDMRFALAGVLIRDGQISQTQYHCSVLETLKPEFEGLSDLRAMLDHSRHPVYALAK
ncbi:MAG: glycosyltransferase [Nitrospirales bacterium]